MIRRNLSVLACLTAPLTTRLTAVASAVALAVPLGTAAVVSTAGPARAAAGPAAGSSPRSSAQPAMEEQPKVPATLSWRNVGPLRGGRSIAVAGSTARPDEYYFGATGGGIWKTTDGGTTWMPASDGFLTSASVGALAVCPSNPDVVYAGTGEVDLRGQILTGDGIYRTTDGGRTWAHDGLGDSQAISKIRIDPGNCDHAYAAVLGHPYGPNTQRGVFRTTDGGRTWQRVLYIDDTTGAADVELDPASPQVIYASMWHASRSPWNLTSGGPGDGLFKSTDGGSTWTNLSTAPGFPKAPLGKIDIAPSAAQPGLVWALVEAKGSAEGLYRSGDGGATWSEVNNDANLHQRPFYFMHLAADPKDPGTVYVLNVSFLKSTDAGKTFQRIRNPHSDNHDIWIDPSSPQRMIEGNDGGANVTVNGGQTWTPSSYPTAQIYHVATTPSPDGVPYLICGAQQDSSTSCVPSDGNGSQFFDVGGGESGYVAVDRQDPNIFYSGSYDGFLSRFDRRLGFNQARDVEIWPDNPMGHPASDTKERFQWTFPIMTSPADPGAVYAASQHVFRSTDGGHSWQRISPDLSRDDPATLGNSGGPINLDQTSVEYYADVFALAPSSLDRNVIWAGSDDGLVHVTRDMGGHWADVTPPGIPHFIRFSVIDASTHDSATAYAAAQRYQLDDTGVYLFRTHDGGRHWTKITNGIPDGAFAWSIRQDPVKANLLYAGTQHGAYVSFDDGAHWQSLALGMPDLSVQDLTVHGDDLVAATFGRGFYVLHGLDLLRQLAPGPAAQPQATPAKPLAQPLVPPALARAAGAPASAEAPASAAEQDMAARPRSRAVAHPGTVPASATSGPVSNELAVLYRPSNPTRSVDPFAAVFYTIKRSVTSVSMTFLDARGRAIRTFSGLPAAVGDHEFDWDMTYPPPVSFPGLIMWAGDPTVGPAAPLGSYAVRLTVDGTNLAQPFSISKDPRLTTVTAADIQTEFQLSTQVVNATSAADQAVINISACTSQVDARVAQADSAPVTQAGQALDAKLGAVRDALWQSQIKAPEDPLKYPIMLNDKIDGLLFVIESADGLPTEQTFTVFRLLSGQLSDQLSTLRQIIGTDVPAFNNMLTRAGLQPVTCTA
ncbi:MAG TPA: hypothetical protein VF070_23335 [Streptosporangiaceae bacterium]